MGLGLGLGLGLGSGISCWSERRNSVCARLEWAFMAVAA